jgi:arginine-tRNA-protein transferase
MRTDHGAPIQRIKLLKTTPHSCSYLSGKRASTGFVAPELAIDVDLYARLSENGFRRSGSIFIRPCAGTAVRVCLRAYR